MMGRESAGRAEIRDVKRPRPGARRERLLLKVKRSFGEKATDSFDGQRTYSRQLQTTRPMILTMSAKSPPISTSIGS